MPVVFIQVTRWPDQGGAGVANSSWGEGCSWGFGGGAWGGHLIETWCHSPPKQPFSSEELISVVCRFIPGKLQAPPGERQLVWGSRWATQYKIWNVLQPTCNNEKETEVRTPSTANWKYCLSAKHRVEGKSHIVNTWPGQHKGLVFACQGERSQICPFSVL